MLTEEQLREMYNETYMKIDDVKLYFELKKRRLIRGKQSIPIIKTIITLTKMHFPITLESVQWASQEKTSMATIHNLGDRNLLVWKRELFERGARFEWMPSPYLADLIAYVWKKKEDAEL